MEKLSNNFCNDDNDGQRQISKALWQRGKRSIPIVDCNKKTSQEESHWNFLLQKSLICSTLLCFPLKKEVSNAVSSSFFVGGGKGGAEAWKKMDKTKMQINFTYILAFTFKRQWYD